MNTHTLFRSSLFAILALLAPGSLLVAAEDGLPPAPIVEKYLEQGKFAEAQTELNTLLKKNPNDQQARFGLGVVQLFVAVEHLAQANYRHGFLQHRGRSFPLFRLPLPKNEKPEELTYEKARRVFATLLKDLAKVEATLAEVDTADVKLPLHFGRIRLDLNEDGKADDEEALWQILSQLTGGIEREAGESFLIVFDGGDVHWLRGYCHLFSAFSESALAYDWHDAFERGAHLLYPRVKTPYKYIAQEKKDPKRRWDIPLFMDAIALVHSINFPLVEPERMPRVLKHLQGMVDQSRASWKRILAETDDDHEWLPNPDQTGVIPDARVSQEMIDGWHEVLDELEAIYQGKKLIPFWRGPKPDNADGLDPLGVNINRVFTEPKQFDLVLWVTGTGAAPYLEKGEITDPAFWKRMRHVFRDEFFGFALWFN